MKHIINRLKVLEEERCRCIVDHDHERLGSLLSRSLIHTHTGGKIDTRKGYLAFVSGVVESLELRRGVLRVMLFGDSVAVMHGKQIDRVRRLGQTEETLVEAVVTQVWALEDDDRWRLTVCHATPLREQPPAVRPA